MKAYTWWHGRIYMGGIMHDIMIKRKRFRKNKIKAKFYNPSIMQKIEEFNSLNKKD